MKKILLISSTNNIKNGYGNITHELASFLKDKVELTLLLPHDEPQYDYTSYNTKYVLPKYLFSLKSKEALKYLAFNYPGEFDLVHSLFEFPYAIIGARLANKKRIPLIIGTQGTYAIRPLFHFPESLFLKYAYNSARTITAASGFTKRAIEKYSHTKTPIKVVHNGVNFDRFQKKTDLVSQIRQKFAGKKILLTVGGLKDRKGQDIILEALGLLVQKRKDFHYLIVGPEEKRDAYLNILHSIIDKHDLGEYVTFAGPKVEQELVDYFYACDVYVHTARLTDWNFEGFGIVYLEAGACGKPSVAADSGGVAGDAVIDGETGIVVPENDPAATATAIEKFLDSDELRAKMGEAAWEYAKEHDWSSIGEQILNLYN